MTGLGHVREIPGQKTWIDHGFPDLRPLATALRSPPPAEVAAAVDLEAAIAILAEAFGLADPALVSSAIGTPVGLVTVVREKLTHIVEKRADARERYVHFAVHALIDPFEVWRVNYDNGNYRLAFIGVFQGKRQMLVIVDTVDGDTLWNFMHTDSKSLNRHRHGMPVYQRAPLTGS